MTRDIRSLYNWSVFRRSIALYFLHPIGPIKYAKRVTSEAWCMEILTSLCDASLLSDLTPSPFISPLSFSLDIIPSTMQISIAVHGNAFKINPLHTFDEFHSGRCAQLFVLIIWNEYIEYSLIFLPM